MELLQLRYFSESAESASFTKTANKYGVPVTSVSASIKRLEKEIGCKLFDRTANRVFLNANGKKLLDTANGLLSRLDAAVGELSSENGDSREIKLLIRGMRRRITGDIIEYRKQNPKTAFKTVFDFSKKNYDEYDVIIDTERNVYPHYERFKLYDMRLFLKAAADDPLCGRKLKLSDLRDRPFISMGLESNTHRILERACARAGFIPEISVVCNDIECYEKLLASGMGIGVTRESAEPDNKNIKALDVSDFDERYTVYSYYRASEYYGNVRSFIDFLRKTDRK